MTILRATLFGSTDLYPPKLSLLARLMFLLRRTTGIDGSIMAQILGLGTSVFWGFGLFALPIAMGYRVLLAVPLLVFYGFFTGTFLGRILYLAQTQDYNERLWLINDSYGWLSSRPLSLLLLASMGWSAYEVVIGTYGSTLDLFFDGLVCLWLSRYVVPIIEIDPETKKVEDMFYTDRDRFMSILLSAGVLSPEDIEGEFK